ncbi:MAG TPA: BMP family ABC transporter substrate-binding protein [Firmicutes bacterium]|nr:BMP family ABC transporter substrate-binding protein [Bacillota bacterium]
MRGRKRTVTVLALVVLALTLVLGAGCGGRDSGGPAPSSGKPKVAMILEGLISDGGWNSAGYNSLMKAQKELGIEVAYVEGVSVANVEAALRDFADKGYDLILAHSNVYTDTVLKVAKDYPKVHFAISQGRKYDTNVVSYSSSVQDTAYLCGMLGAYMSKTGKLGFISGMQIPSQVAALNAYREGAKAVKPDIQVIHSFPGVWNDTEKGRQAALAQIEAGVDFLMPRGDGLALGAIQACKEKGVFAIGNASDQWAVAPGTIITSQLQDYSPYVKVMLDDIKAGKFGNREYVLGLKEGATGLSDYHGLVPADVAEKIQAAVDKIKSGELVIKEDTQMHQ